MLGLAQQVEPEMKILRVLQSMRSISKHWLLLNFAENWYLAMRDIDVKVHKVIAASWFLLLKRWQSCGWS